METCVIEGCPKLARKGSRGMCAMHYERVRVHGDPHATLRPQRGLPPEEQYERYVDRTSTPDGCHLWTGPLFQTGYGRVKYDGVEQLAHRWGYRHYVGPISEGLVVRHTCDVKRCQNPTHWVIGTVADNNRDRDERGRTSRGESHGTAKLTDEEVIQIRDRYASGGVSQQDLANEFGLSQVSISDIVRHVNWRHLGGPLADSGNAKLSEADVIQIRARYAAGGVSQQALADQFGVSQYTISCTVRRRSWKQVS
jgi:DNA-binding XRE family transcriptional regulator